MRELRPTPFERYVAWNLSSITVRQQLIIKGTTHHYLLKRYLNACHLIFQTAQEVEDLGTSSLEQLPTQQRLHCTLRLPPLLNQQLQNNGSIVGQKHRHTLQPLQVGTGVADQKPPTTTETAATAGVVSNRWTGLWTGLLNWIAGLDCWTGFWRKMSD